MEAIGEPISAACQSPLSMTGVILIVVLCCVLGIVWAAFNFLLVTKINVQEGNDGESDSLVGDIPEEQKKLLLELGEKIQNVNSNYILGSHWVFKARIPHLPRFQCCNVHRDYVPDGRRSHHRSGLRSWSHHFDNLWSSRHDHRHSS